MPARYACRRHPTRDFVFRSPAKLRRSSAALSRGFEPWSRGGGGQPRRAGRSHLGVRLCSSPLGGGRSGGGSTGFAVRAEVVPQHFCRGPPSQPPPWTGGRSQRVRGGIRARNGTGCGRADAEPPRNFQVRSPCSPGPRPGRFRRRRLACAGRSGGGGLRCSPG